MDSLGQKIRKIRKERGITQIELCEGIVTSSMISQIESDRATPSLALLERLAKRLQVDVSQFMPDIHQKTDLAHTYRRARHLLDIGRYEEALPLLKTVCFPLAPQFKGDVVYNDLAHCYQTLGRLSEAAQTYELVVQAALEKDEIPAAVHAYFNLGTLERRRNRLSLARMYWQRANEFLLRYPDLHMPVSMRIRANLGRVYREEQRYDLAIACFESAIVTAETYAPPLELAMVYHGLSNVYIELQNYEEAIRFNTKAWNAYDYAHHTRGVNQCKINHLFIMRCMGRHTEAVEKLSEYIPTREMHDDPIRLANAFGERAQNLLALGHCQDALEDADKAISFDKENSTLLREMHFVRAQCFMVQEKYEKVIQEVEQGLRHVKNSEVHHYIRFQRLERTALERLGQPFVLEESMIQLAEAILGV